MKIPDGWGYYLFQDKSQCNLTKYVAQVGKDKKEIHVDIKPCNKEEADFCAWVVNFTETNGRFPTPKDIEA
jgi:hypothetical protein